MAIRPIRLLKDWSVFPAGRILTPPGGFALTLIDRGFAEDYEIKPGDPHPLETVGKTRNASSKRRGWPKGKPRGPRRQSAESV